MHLPLVPLKKEGRAIFAALCRYTGMNIGAPVDLFEHSVQSATRALRDGAGEEKAVCALMHDVGELLVPACHGEVGQGEAETKDTLLFSYVAIITVGESVCFCSSFFYTTVVGIWEL